MNWKYHVDEYTNSIYDIILVSYLLTALGLDLNFSDDFITGVKGTHEGCSSPMVDVRN